MIGSIRSRRVLAALRSDGIRVRSGSVRMRYLPASPEAARDAVEAGPEIAFAFSRSFGKAVDRNRARRRLRSAFIEAWNGASAQPRPGAFLLSGTRKLLTSTYQQIVADVTICLAQLCDPATAPTARRAQQSQQS